MTEPQRNVPTPRQPVARPQTTGLPPRRPGAPPNPPPGPATGVDGHRIATEGTPAPREVPERPHVPVNEVEPGQRPEALFDQAKLTGAVLLPSKGRFYGGKLPDGMVEVLLLTAREDKILAGIDETNVARIFDMILARCVRSPISPSEMLSTDRYYVLLALRARAVGPEYQFPYECPFCNKVQIGDIKIPQDFRMDEGKATEEPFYCKLPTTGHTVGMRFLRGKDDVEIEAYRNRTAKGDEPGDAAFGFAYAKQIVTVDGKPFPDIETAMAWFLALPLKDSREFRRTANTAAPGVITATKVKCNYCNEEPQVRVPLPAELFFAG